MINTVDERIEQRFVDVVTLQGLEPLCSLSSERLAELAAQLPIEVLPPDTIVFREGDRDNKLIFLLAGEVELFSPYLGRSWVITAGMPETWHPIAHKQPRQEHAVTSGEVELFRVDVEQFDAMLTWEQMSQHAFQIQAENSSGMVEDDRAKCVDKMRQSLPFYNLPAANLEALFSRLEPIEVAAGDKIIRQGEAGDYYYIIDSGLALVTRDIPGQSEPIELATLSDSDSFGEEALISDVPRSASVTMVSNGRLLRLSKSDFVELLEEPMLSWLDLNGLFDRLEEHANCLDVRLHSEYKEGHLPTAINIPLHELRSNLDKLDQEQEYICYCSTGRRSSAAAFLLKQRGYNVSVLKGGLQVVPSSYLIRRL